MLTYFKTLGERIEFAWRAHSYDEAIFSQLVLDSLSGDPPSSRVEVGDIVDWAFSPLHDFLQPESGGRLFGEPPIVLFQAPRFYIEALFWHSGTTDIHEHAFSGAFAVLSGSSVHSHWKFSCERVINSRMLRGRLDRVSTEILGPGDVRPIHSGGRLIHQLFHLESPSVTIVVRTYLNRNSLPQFKYILPGLAIDTESVGSLLTRRLMLLSSMVNKSSHADLRNYAGVILTSGDVEALYHTLSHLVRHQVSADLMAELYAMARQCYGDEILEFFRKVCEGERRTRAVVASRSKVLDPNARFLLALLMLMPDRASILEAIQLEVPDADPVSIIEGWIERISGRVLGFDFNDVNRILFRSLVEGLEAEELLQRLRNEYSWEPVDAQTDRRLVERARKLATSDLFFPLFSESPLRRNNELWPV